MLGNIAPLWEVILAAIKLGVVIIPASTLLSPDDLADRIKRGEVRFVVTETAQREKFQGLPGFGAVGWTPILVEPGAGGKAGPWHRYAEAFGAPAEFAPDGPTAASDPLLLYFTSGTTAQVGNCPGQPLKPGSMGKPLPGYTVALLDLISGEPAEEGEL